MCMITRNIKNGCLMYEVILAVKGFSHCFFRVSCNNSCLTFKRVTRSLNVLYELQGVLASRELAKMPIEKHNLHGQLNLLPDARNIYDLMLE